MKIIFIIDQVYLHGGIERVLSIKASYFSKESNNEVHIITTEQKNNKTCYDFSDKIIFKDIEINYNRNKSYFHPINLLKLPKHILKIRSEINKIKPDVVVVCSHSTDTYFMPFIAKSVPKIKEFHFSKFIEVAPRANPRNFLKKWFFKFTDYVESKYDQLVVLNSNEIGYYKSENTTVIPNPLTFFPDTTSNLENKTIISAGRIAHVKGYDILIDIWELVCKLKNDWQIHIYGDGESNYVNHLKRKVKEKGLQKSFIFKGATSDIKGKMLESSIYVMSSRNECFPLVLLEAQACGLPIVSFDCPHGPKSILNPYNGVLIPLNDNAFFAERLVELMKNNEQIQRMGDSARKNAQNYSVDKVMKLWEDMFIDLINKNSTP